MKASGRNSARAITSQPRLQRIRSLSSNGSAGWRAPASLCPIELAGRWSCAFLHRAPAPPHASTSSTYLSRSVSTKESGAFPLVRQFPCIEACAPPRPPPCSPSPSAVREAKPHERYVLVRPGVYQEHLRLATPIEMSVVHHLWPLTRPPQNRRGTPRLRGAQVLQSLRYSPHLSRRARRRAAQLHGAKMDHQPI